MSTLPVILVAGFLGAGKTTLMRRLIRDGHARGLKLCVVVNEFGAADVDGHILREADAELLASITGGCACCSGQDDFHDTILEIALRPQDQKPDVVLVEASGLADPSLMLEVLTSPELLPRVRVTKIICVADAARPAEYSAAEFRTGRAAEKPVAARRSHRAQQSRSFQPEYSARVAGTVSKIEFDFSMLWNFTENKTQNSKLKTPPTRRTRFFARCPTRLNARDWKKRWEICRRKSGAPKVSCDCAAKPEYSWCSSPAARGVLRAGDWRRFICRSVARSRRPDSFSSARRWMKSN